MIDDDDDDAAANCLDLGRTLEIINSLIHSSYPTRCFPAKWQSIRDKLDQLSSVLAAAGVISSSSSSALAELVEAISATIGEAQLLAQRCSDESYHGGKLQLRSDVDVIAGKLELHIKHLLEINTSGVLNNSRAIILTRPRPSASREDMRLYVRDLLSRMKIGDLEMRARALAALNDILGDGGDKYVSIVAAETADGISLLLCLLESREIANSSSSNIQEDVAAAISLISGFDGHRGALVAAGAIAQLVHVLETGSSPTAKMSAIRAMKNLTENSENAWSVSAHGGVTTLLKLCGGDDAGSNTELIGLACDILRNLSGVKEIKKFMVEEGVVTVLVKLSRSKHELSQIRAVEFLIALLASEDATIKQVVVREGTVDSLVQILDPNSSSCSTKARELALRAIEGLCSDSTSSNSVNVLLGSGILDRLLFFLSSGEISVQESALKAAFRFCSASPEANKAMGEVGFMPELVNLLEARSFEVREMAAGVLCSMVSVQRNRRRFIGEGQGINQIMHLLDQAGEEKSVNKMSLLSVLMLLTDSSSGRRKVAASRYMKNLEKLAETDVTDAKKIVKKLSVNRFRSVLNDIWRSYH